MRAPGFARQLGAFVSAHWLPALLGTLAWLAAEGLVAGTVQCPAAQTCPWSAQP